VAAPETSSPEGDGQGVSPTSPESSLPPEDDPLDPGDEPDESLIPPPSEDAIPEPRGEVVTLVGAAVGISGAAGEVRVIWAIPSPGFSLVPLAGTEIEEGSVTMVFSDGSHRSTLAARWDDTEGLIVDTTEGRLELSP
jgi:hypothetical protein